MDPGFIVLFVVAMVVFVMFTGAMISGCLRGDLTSESMDVDF